MGHAALRFCVRTDDPDLVEQLMAVEGATWRDALAGVGATILERSPHRVVTTPGFMTTQLDRLRPLYRDRCAALVQALRAELGDRFEFAAPGGGMFVWGRFVDAIDTHELLPKALERGMAYVPGQAFAVEGDHRQALRLSFATAMPAQLSEGVRRLASALPPRK